MDLTVIVARPCYVKDTGLAILGCLSFAPFRRDATATTKRKAES